MRRDVHWLWGGLQPDLPENVLRQMDPSTRARILDPALKGQGRVNQLFKSVPSKILSRHVINTVGQQDDAPKRARDARRLDRGIRSEGYLVLGHQGAHPQIAERLGIAVAEKGEWVSVRVARVPEASHRRKVRLASEYWAVALPGDPIDVAPEIPAGKLPAEG